MMVYQGFYGSPPSGMTRDEERSARALEAVDEAEGKRIPPDFSRSMRAYQDEFETYVKHPSIIIYVLSNEMPYKGKDAPAVHDFLTRAFDHLSKWDQTRLYIGNAGYGEGHEGDLNDVHRYWGWYYNSFLTFLNLRDAKLFGDYEKGQPLTFSECIGNFTGPSRAYNYIEKKQLASALGWTGTAPANEQAGRAQAYQRFSVAQVTESFRRMRSINPRISGIMPFTITFRNWRGIKSFAEMQPTAAADQFGTSYQPVLLSWENWTPQVYTGTKGKLIAHIVNDADDFSDLTGATLRYAVNYRNFGQVELPSIPYYGTHRQPIEIDVPEPGPGGVGLVAGTIVKGDRVISSNHSWFFIAGNEWKAKPPATKRQLVIAPGKTADALATLAFATTASEQLDPAKDCLIIGEEEAPRRVDVKTFVNAGGRVLCLGPKRDGSFDPSWLPGGVTLLEHSVNEPTYPVEQRPAYDQAHVNPQWTGHPVLAGIERDHLRYWSDYTGWDQTKPGFPRISPVRFGYKLTKQADLKNIAVIANYDSGLEGVALGEFFDGKGSALLCGLDLVGRIGFDPVADRMLKNLVAYMADDAAHAKHPTVTKPIRWGDFASEQGVLVDGTITGLFRNTTWQPPPTDPHGEPPRDKLNGWNTRPSDQYLPDGIRPRGPFVYTFNGAVRNVDHNNASGWGVFWASVPAGRKSMITKVRNPTTRPATLRVDVNGADGEPRDLPPGSTSVIIETPLPPDVSDIGVRYTGDRDLVIEETDFR
jgi:hypothetical protein